MTTRRLHLTEVDEVVLRSVNRFRYLTAAQLNRLLWPENTKDENRYAQRRLRRLAERAYLLPLAEVSKPARGTAPHVYALAWRGRQALLERGFAVPSYYRPSELEEASRNPIFMPHTLAVIDVLIAVERLTQDASDVLLTQLHTEQELRRMAMRVRVPGVAGVAPTRQITVIPDGVFSLWVGGVTQDFVLEVDRGTERQPVWRNKVAALCCWLDSDAASKLLPSEHLTVMIVTPDARRLEKLRTWTARELQDCGLFDRYAGLFAFTSASPVATTPTDFFLGRHWLPPFTGTSDSLVDLPEQGR